VSEVALGGLIGHIMLAVEEGAPGLGQGKVYLSLMLRQISVRHISFLKVKG
jgi:hypothetical protein